MARYDMENERGIFQSNRAAEPKRISGGIEESVMNEGEPFNAELNMESAKQTSLKFDPSDPQSVRDMQRKLNELGVVDEPLALDGVFGEKTESAVRRLQSMSQYNPGQRFGFKSLPNEPSQLSSPELNLNNQDKEMRY